MTNFDKHLPSSVMLQHIVFIVGAGLLLIVLVAILISLRARANYLTRWKALQKLLSNKTTWKDAVLEADKLLDTVLKKQHYKGKTMGERLVSAQHELSANDMVWYSHKLSNKILNDGVEVSKLQVKKALLGFWKALKDLGAFGKQAKKADGHKLDGNEDE